MLLLPVITAGAGGFHTTGAVEHVGAPDILRGGTGEEGRGNGRSTNDTRYTIMLAGDVMLGRSVGRSIDETSVDHPFSRTDHAVRGADLAVANLECAVSERGSPVPGKHWTFRADPSTLEGVKSAGFDSLVLANNHVGDYGPDALNDTVEHCRDARLTTTGLWYEGDGPEEGIGRPVLAGLARGDTTKGPDVALLSYAENVPSSFNFGDGVPGPIPLRDSVMEEDIAYASSVSDMVFVSVHWSRMPQYVTEADDGQKELCRQLVDWGADVVWCHGPHVLQEVEGYGGGLILYSLGNYVFDLAEESSHRGALAAVTVGVGGDGESWEPDHVELLPFRRSDMRPVPSGAVLSGEVTDGLWWDRGNFDEMFAAPTDWGRWEEDAVDGGDGADGSGGGDVAGTSGDGDGDDGAMGLLLPALVVVALGVPAALALRKGAGRKGKD